MNGCRLYHTPYYHLPMLTVLTLNDLNRVSQRDAACIECTIVESDCHALAIEAFYSLFWLGQGVTRVGILCPFSMFL
jgi:hypothetical protein